MHILITGATGLIGRALITALQAHQITILTRSPAKALALFPHVTVCANQNALPDFNALDAVINLAGEPIMGKRWNKQQKERICESRWGITRMLTQKIQEATTPPKIFISASAVGYYSDQGSRIITETLTVNETDFAHLVCDNWEKIALAARDKTRVCLLRTGIVLSKNGGALQKMLLPYKLGLGGPIGNAEQYVSWVHIDDVIGAIVHLLNNPDAHGPFNITSPNPVTNRQLSEILAHTLHRPHFLFIPTWAIKFALGEASQLLLDSQRAIPEALEKSGYQCKFPELKDALIDILSGS